MKAAGISDAALARLASTNKQQIGKLKNGERKLTVQWAKRLAGHLPFDWQDLVESRNPDLRRSTVLAAFDRTDEQGREMLHRLASSLLPN